MNNKPVIQPLGNSKIIFSERVVITAIIVLAGLLRFYQLGTESLWVDEYFSIRDAVNLNLGSRPFYYLLLHIWMNFGGTDSDVWLRIFSLIFSVAIIWLIYRLARKLTGKRASQIAAFMAAISPIFVGYGQEIRMYALSTFLTLVGTIFLVEFLETQSYLKIVAWSIVRWLAILTTPLNITLLLPDFLICVGHFRRRWRCLLMVGCGVLFISVATVPSALILKTKAPEFMESWVSYKAKPDFLDISGMLTELTMFWPLSDLPRFSNLNLHPTTIGTQELVVFFYGLMTLIVVTLLVFAILQAIKQFQNRQLPPKLLWITGWSLLPVLSILLVSYFSGTIWFARYLLFAAPYFLILLAVAFIYCWDKYRIWAISLAVIYCIAVSGGLFHYYTTLYHDDWKGIARIIEVAEKPKDVIGLYASHWDLKYTLPRYYQGTLPIQMMNSKLSQNRLDTVDEAKIFAKSMLRMLPSTEGRYWIVVYHPHAKILNKAIKSQDTFLWSRRFPNSVNEQVYLYLLDSKTPST